MTHNQAAITQVRRGESVLSSWPHTLLLETRHNQRLEPVTLRSFHAALQRPAKCPPKHLTKEKWHYDPLSYFLEASFVLTGMSFHVYILQLPSTRDESQTKIKGVSML